MTDQIQYFTSLQWGDVLFLGEAALRTLGISVAAISAGTLLGVVLGWLLTLRSYVLNLGIASLLDVFRSVPLLIQLILFDSFVAIAGFPLTAFSSGTIVLSLYTAGLVAMVAKSGIESVSQSMRRAARSLGMTYFQDMRYIVWPVGLRSVLPSWIGVALSVVKDSALVSAIGYVELLRASQILTTKTQESFKIMLLIGLFYFLLSYPIARAGDLIEKKLKR
ncbi:amino acid ABC transporter [Rhizobium anhuiense]|uniref:amino acid ABC transporter permease n=1 Tax=Rhizobium anhuiense TaxID=1184720 RepID=UPI000BEA5157|nr:amino acid ABC transporter permease [Rhizobium anhuiense]PDS59937.1 amino acid ABC transporter [Rhizobium anhuiense]